MLFDIRKDIKTRGVRGFVDLQRALRGYEDGTGMTHITLSDFQRVLNEQYLGMSLSDLEFKILFQYLDSDDTGAISRDEIMTALRKPLSERRNRFVSQAFATLDRNETGVVDGFDLIDTFSPFGHPDVVSKKVPVEQV
jgi:Ca2+-binding EF-hand superfamily protein